MWLNLSRFFLSFTASSYYFALGLLPCARYPRCILHHGTAWGGGGGVRMLYPVCTCNYCVYVNTARRVCMVSHTCTLHACTHIDTLTHRTPHTCIYTHTHTHTHPHRTPHTRTTRYRPKLVCLNFLKAGEFS